ncbi:MAG: hypothetical protein KatS3mg110_0323 [Pirellulaceae bacterium]|nr:MAG: hypothetical protein KatS3mg110_0323 [Pirellulaceae bacterium]
MRVCISEPLAILQMVLLCATTFGQSGRMLPWPEADPAAVGLDVHQLKAACEYGASADGSGLVIYRGHVVAKWGDLVRRYDLKSTTKSIGVTALGLAIADGLVSLDDSACRYHPEFGVPPESNRLTGWLERITLRQLATHTSGFPKPGGYGALQFEPGTKWLYSDAGPNWLAECLTMVYRRDMREVMFERVFSRIGITPDDLTWRENAYRPRTIAGIARREFGSGIHANVVAMARIGYLYLKRGKWDGEQILPEKFVEWVGESQESLRGLPEAVADYGNASEHYGLLWWNNADRTLADVPSDAYWSWGLYDSLIVVVPSLDLVAVRAGSSWPRPQPEHYAVLRPFLEPLCRAVGARRPEELRGDARGPYPYSRVFAGIQWAPPETIRRWASGSDNWPITAASDQLLFTAYGDGRGFPPFAPKKLSLGLAMVMGRPPELVGRNVPCPTLKRLGDGASGPKASGMLMVDNVLYLLVRNVGNAQLVWSDDQGKTWHWVPWRFTVSFGCPTFLNFGPNYSRARDQYAYIFSPDGNSAYQPSDRFVLARAPVKRMLEQDAYEYFVGVGAEGEPLWSKNIQDRGAVFTHRKRCYRSGISYHAPSGRYLWYQVLPESAHPHGPRFAGGMGVFEAPEPWGPWYTVYFTENWDVGPGESGCFPTPWMDENGEELYLLFSGNDCFSIRRGRLVTVR